jgi:RNA polymerase sigma-70 factor, ECF subfamily
MPRRYGPYRHGERTFKLLNNRQCAPLANPGHGQFLEYLDSRLHPLAAARHYRGMATATMSQPGNLAELVRLHQAGVWRYLRFLGCDESQADDLTQETFLAVHRRPFDERGDAATAAYLRTVARNQFLMSVRRDRRRPDASGLLVELDPADADLAETVWATFAGDDGGETWLDALRGCVEELNGRARQAIDLHYRDDQSRARIAAELDMTEDGVKSLLRRTREVLRKCVEGKMT